MNSLSNAQKAGDYQLNKKRGILKLIPKKDKNPCFLQNWRPISLLNTDYKLIAHILANRLQHVLPEIVSQNQNGYLRERYIGYNIRTIIDIIDNATLNNQPCLIAFLDFEKAFDRIDWKFIKKSLTFFNFGKNFKNWIKIMYNDVSSCTLNNGYSSTFFPIKRGVRQGCPLSALLFILCVELLSIHIEYNNNIKGVSINQNEQKLTQLADDTTLFLKDVSSLRYALEALDNFQKISGLKLNRSKTEVLALGSHDNLKQLKLKIVGNTCSLGIWYSKSLDDIILNNHLKKLEDIKTLFNTWKRRKLTLYGKATVIKTLAIPKLNHVIANLATPEWFSEGIQKLIIDFIWDGKPPKIKTSVIRNTIQRGGLKIPDVELHIKSQKISWIKRMLKQNLQASWMQLLCTTLPEMKLTDMLKCSINPNDIAVDIPTFYKQILADWYEIKASPKSAFDVRREIIWYNKYIQINGNCVFQKSLYDKGIITLHNLLLENGTFMSYEQFIEKYNVRLNFLKYMALIDAIPQKWKSIVKTQNIPHSALNNQEVPHMKVGMNMKDIRQVKTCEIYSSLLSSIETNPPCVDAWSKRISTVLTENDWKKIFSLPKLTTLETKVLNVQYKILHRCYATDSKIAKWNKNKNPICPKCKLKANIVHNFFFCNEIKTFWCRFEQWYFENFNTENIHLSLEDVIFGKYNGCDNECLNHALLYAKFYIHKQYILGKTVAFENYQSFYNFVLECEKQRYIMNNKIDTFNKKFIKCKLLSRI